LDAPRTLRTGPLHPRRGGALVDPFEFPIDHWIVAGIVAVTKAPLEVVARLTSLALIVACLSPTGRIAVDLRLGNRAFPVFGMLLFTSPLYLYWGRTIPIETAAL